MGTDIHAILEYRYPGDNYRCFCEFPTGLDRNYSFFSALSGMQGESIDHINPRGLPGGISHNETLNAVHGYHGASWLTADEYNRSLSRYIAYALRVHNHTVGRDNQYVVVAMLLNELPDARFTFAFDS